MLVLSRRPGERIFIGLPDGRRIEIELVRLSPLGARIGITAPREMTILREEMLAAEARADSPADTGTFSIAS